LKLGLSVEIAEDPHAEETTLAADIEAVKQRQNKELKQLLEAEQRAEKEREAKISAATTDDEKANLMKENE
jgi:hypothetical protein